MSTRFEQRLHDLTGHTVEQLMTLSFGKEGLIYHDIYESIKQQYAEESNTSRMQFDAWLKKRSGHTEEELLVLALQTGTYKEYKQLMAFYRERYAKEKQTKY